MSDYYVYIVTNNTRVLYIGVTNDLARRVAEHKAGSIAGFTQRYGLRYLVYYEQSVSITDTIAREKQLKGWRRQKKLDLIEKLNPTWRDLSMDPSTSSG